jgi:TonB family protein
MGVPVRGDVEAVAFVPPEGGVVRGDGGSSPRELTVGEKLAALRMAKDLTLENVFNGTKIKIVHLKAIESGDATALPAVPFTAGFIKAYAQFLDLDPEDWARSYRAEIAARSPSTPAVAAVPAAVKPSPFIASSALAPLSPPPSSIAREVARPPMPAFSQNAASSIAVGAAAFCILWFGASTLTPGPGRRTDAASSNQAMSADNARTAVPPSPVLARRKSAAPKARQPAPSAPPTSAPQIEALQPTDQLRPPVTDEEIEATRLRLATEIVPSRKPPAPVAQEVESERPQSKFVEPTPSSTGETNETESGLENTAATPLQEPVVRAAMLEKAASPRYPERCVFSAAAAESVDVVVDIRPDGKPQNARIGGTSNACFNSAAVDAAYRMRFSPRTVDGRASAEFAKTVTVRFVR